MTDAATASAAAVANGMTNRPDCGASNVRRQLSVFAAHGTAEQPSFGETLGGGSCCGGTCGCG